MTSNIEKLQHGLKEKHGLRESKNRERERERGVAINLFYRCISHDANKDTDAVGRWISD